MGRKGESVPNPQASNALELARFIKSKRRELRVELRALGARDGANRAADLLADPPDWIAKLPVKDLLRMVPRIGVESATLVLAASGCPDRRRVEDLTLRQNEAVRSALRAHANKPWGWGAAKKARGLLSAALCFGSA